MWQSWPLCEGLPEGPQQNCLKSEFKCKRGMRKKAGWIPQKPVVTQPTFLRWGSQSLRTSWKYLFLNPNPLTWWSGLKNIARVKIGGESAWALSDSSLTINVVTPEFVGAHSLYVFPLNDLMDDSLGINGFGGVFSWSLGYGIVRVQLEGVQGYDEDQAALVVLDSTVFGSQVPVTLGTPTINWIINMIKKAKSMNCQSLWMDQGWPSCWHIGEQNYWLRKRLPCTKWWIRLT